MGGMTHPVRSSEGLLPVGIRDMLMEEAEGEAALIDQLLVDLRGYGYWRVKPPLMEFEDTLLQGAGAAMERQIFRVMDPVSQRMLGVRADITPQIARIAATRLIHAARPLRLCYTGQVLRVRAGQLRTNRQFTQVGGELIGIDCVAADVEVILLAVEALQRLGVMGLSVDICTPPLVPAMLAALDLSKEQAFGLHHALDRKDSAALDQHIATLSAADRHAIIALSTVTGTAEEALVKLEAITLSPKASVLRTRLLEVVTIIRQQIPTLSITIDVVEHRGFEYHTGLGFSLFARGGRGELGRGGRYCTQAIGEGASYTCQAGARGEAATGFTLYTDSILQILSPLPVAKRLYMPMGSKPELIRRQRQEGWIIVKGLVGDTDPVQQARQLECTHIWLDNQIISCT